MEGACPCKYVVRCHIVAYRPVNRCNFVIPTCPHCHNRMRTGTNACEFCHVADVTPVHMFLFSLHLQDSTAECDAFLCKEDAERFFGGISADVAIRTGDVLAKIEQTLQNIVQMCPQLFCLKSYFSSTSPDRRLFQICDTTVVES